MAEMQWAIGKISVAESVTYCPCSTDASRLDTTQESDLVGCWTSAEEVPAPEGQQQRSKHHSTQKAAKDGNCKQQSHTGACFHLAPLHAAFNVFAARQQQQLELAQSNGFSSVELTRTAPWNTCAATFSATVILIRSKDHHNRSSKTTEHEHTCPAGCMTAD